VAIKILRAGNWIRAISTCRMVEERKLISHESDKLPEGYQSELLELTGAARASGLLSLSVSSIYSSIRVPDGLLPLTCLSGRLSRKVKMKNAANFEK
jgi:hypothetical protein